MKTERTDYYRRYSSVHWNFLWRHSNNPQLVNQLLPTYKTQLKLAVKLIIINSWVFSYYVATVFHPITTFQHFYLHKSYITATSQTYVNTQTIFNVCISLASTKWSGGHRADISTLNTGVVEHNTGRYGGQATHWNVLFISQGSVSNQI